MCYEFEKIGNHWLRRNISIALFGWQHTRVLFYSVVKLKQILSRYIDMNGTANITHDILKTVTYDSTLYRGKKRKRATHVFPVIMHWNWLWKNYLKQQLYCLYYNNYSTGSTALVLIITYSN